MPKVERKRPRLARCITATFGLSLALGGLACGEGSSSTEAPVVGFPGPSADGGFISFSPNSLPGSNGGSAIPGVMPARLALLAAPTTPPPPISGGTLSVNADGSLVVAADTDRDAVHVLIGATGLRSVALAPGSEPGRVVIDDHRHAHVALRGSGALALIDLDAASLISTTPVCTQPRGLAYDSAQQTLSVVCASGKLVTVRAADHTFVSELLLDSDVRDIVGTESTGFKLSRYRSAELISLASDGRPLGRAFAKGAVRANFMPNPESEGPAQLHFSAAVAWRTVQSAQGTSWMLHQQSQSDVVAESAGGYASGCSTVTSGAATEFDQSGNPTRVLPLTLGGLSVDLAVAPNGRWLAVASPGGYVQKVSTLQLLDTRNAAPEVPEGLCGGSPPAMIGADDAQVTAVAFDGAGVLYAFSREPGSISSYRVDETSNSLSLLARVPVGGNSLRDTGHDMFHADVGTGLSCAACHGEATDDGHVWNFSESGPRRTQNVRGGILASAPYHWAGDLADVQHLLDEVMTGRMGGFNVDPQFASALGTWLDAQPQQAVQAAEPDAAARGKALFESASVACATCHGGPRFSNGKSEDVGTGGSFQVPSLLGVSLRPPFMHDGCAATLAARFEPSCGGGDKHGHTTKLSEAERADLIAYLASI